MNITWAQVICLKHMAEVPGMQPRDWGKTFQNAMLQLLCNISVMAKGKKFNNDNSGEFGAES